MSSNSDKIAVIGMACRYPGASTIEEYWNNLLSGKETIKHFTDDELQEYEFNFEELRNNSNYVKARGVLEDVDKFDASFFGYNTSDANLTDPQHRIWLETTWHALENAGCDPFSYKGPIGVFAGGYINTYLLNNVLRDSKRLENFIRLRTAESFQVMTASDIAFLPTKTAYQFNLKGPAINVQTACSTSLVAIIEACKSLYSFETDICIAGGVCVLTPQETGYIFQEGAIPSPDGHCRPFDADAQGTVFSNGVGVVILKRLDDAINDKDNIIAVVDGWALNNDGNKKVSYTAPSVDGQKEAILIAQSFAGVSAEQIGYIETHGTATKLGDPIEIAALTQAFSRTTNKKQYCGIGSVKSNIGHTDAAAGVASFIKACLIAKHKIIPPTLHYKTPNPFINFENSPFYVVDKLTKWESPEKLIIGVSSFGIGGTNAHLLLEEPPKKIENKKTETPLSKAYILPFSAKSSFSLNKMKDDFKYKILKNNLIDIDNLAFTLWNGRTHMKYRSSVVLSDLVQEKIIFNDAVLNENLTSIAFMFPGQGAQYFQMGKNLYNENEKFKNIVDEGLELFKLETSLDLKQILFNKHIDSTEEIKLSETSFTQPALFIIEYALAKVLIDRGVVPSYLIGHSIGEYVAACIAEIFDFPTALKVVIKRGQLMQKMKGGKMFVAFTSFSELQKLSDNLFEIAAENAPESCTISLEYENIDKVEELLKNNDIKYLPLQTSHAFHSASFDPILRDFSVYVNSFKKNTPKIKVISCLTGEFLTYEQAVSGEYWAEQLRNSVLFYKGITTILSSENVLFVEVGPNAHLSSILKNIPEAKTNASSVLTIGKADTETKNNIIDTVLARIWASFPNFVPNLDFIDSKAQKIDLPQYPFEHKSYWIDFKIEDLKQVSSSDLNSNNKKGSNSNNDSDSIKHRIKSILSELSGLLYEEIQDDKKFEDFGFDSLFLVRFAMALENEFKCKIEFRKLVFEFPNIDALCIFLKQNSKIDNFSQHIISRSYLDNFTPFSTEGDGIPLIMVHGDDLNFHLSKKYKNKRPYYGYLHLSADGHKNPFSSVQTMAAHYLKQLLQFKPHGSFILGGFSFGGILAFEMALQLEKLGHKVPLLFIMDCGTAEARVRYDNVRAKKEASVAPKSLEKIVCLFKRYYYKFYYISIRILRNSLFIVLKKLPIKYRRKYVYDIYTNLSLKYKINGKFNGGVVIFKASENYSDMEYLGWHKYADNIHELVVMNGNHESVLKKDDTVQLILDKFDFYLSKCCK